MCFIYLYNLLENLLFFLEIIYICFFIYKIIFKEILIFYILFLINFVFMIYISSYSNIRSSKESFLSVVYKTFSHTGTVTKNFLYNYKKSLFSLSCLSAAGVTVYFAGKSMGKIKQKQKEERVLSQLSKNKKIENFVKEHLNSREKENLSKITELQKSLNNTRAQLYNSTHKLEALREETQKTTKELDKKYSMLYSSMISSNNQNLSGNNESLKFNTHFVESINSYTSDRIKSSPVPANLPVITEEIDLPNLNNKYPQQYPQSPVEYPSKKWPVYTLSKKTLIKNRLLEPIVKIEPKSYKHSKPNSPLSADCIMQNNLNKLIEKNNVSADYSKENEQESSSDHDEIFYKNVPQDQFSSPDSSDEKINHIKLNPTTKNASIIKKRMSQQVLEEDSDSSKQVSDSSIYNKFSSHSDPKKLSSNQMSPFMKHNPILENNLQKSMSNPSDSSPAKIRRIQEKNKEIHQNFIPTSVNNGSHKDSLSSEISLHSDTSGSKREKISIKNIPQQEKTHIKHVSDRENFSIKSASDKEKISIKSIQKEKIPEPKSPNNWNDLRFYSISDNNINFNLKEKLNESRLAYEKKQNHSIMLYRTNSFSIPKKYSPARPKVIMKKK